MVWTNSVEDFIAHWRETGGLEFANMRSSLMACAHCLVCGYRIADAAMMLFNDYVFERREF